MTQTRSTIGATRRAGDLGVHSLDSFNFIVLDLDAAETFYEYVWPRKSRRCPYTRASA